MWGESEESRAISGEHLYPIPLEATLRSTDLTLFWGLIMNKEVSQVGIVALASKSFVYKSTGYLLTLIFMEICLDLRSFKVIIKHVLAFLIEKMRKVLNYIL